MRQLSLQEISSVSGAEKALFEMTPSDFLPYIAAFLGATFLGPKALGWTKTYVSGNDFMQLAGQALGLATGGVGSFLATQQANEHVVQKYVV